MRRRTLLATLPALIAGCSGRLDDSEDTPTNTQTTASNDPQRDTPTDTATETATETPTDSPPPWAEFDLLELERPTLSESKVRTPLDDRDCTELANASVCPGDDARVTVSLSQRVASLSDAELELSIRNDSDEAYSWNPYWWSFWTFDGRSWRRLAPIYSHQPLDYIEPGETYTYSLQLNHGPFEDLEITYRTPEPVNIHGLGPGIYGFVNDSGYFGDPEDDPVPVGATFGLAGQAPALRPTDDVVRVERDGSELIVETGTDDEKWELLVTFVDDADADLRAEHVRMVKALRNTVSFAPVEGIDAVRYVDYRGHISTGKKYPSFWTPDGTTSYGIGDYAFEIE